MNSSKIIKHSLKYTNNAATLSIWLTTVCRLSN